MVKVPNVIRGIKIFGAPYLETVILHLARRFSGGCRRKVTMFGGLVYDVIAPMKKTMKTL